MAASLLVIYQVKRTCTFHLQHYITYIGSLFTAAQYYDVEMARLLVLLSSM